MAWVEKDTLILEKKNYVFAFIRLYRWCIPLNAEYGAAKPGDVFIDSLKFQNSFLVTTHNVLAKAARLSESGEHKKGRQILFHAFSWTFAIDRADLTLPFVPLTVCETTPGLR